MSIREWTIHVRPREPRFDPFGTSLAVELAQLGLGHIRAVRAERLFFLRGALAPDWVRQVAREIFLDPPTEICDVWEGLTRREGTASAIEVHYLPGVMDPAALTALKTLRRALRRAGYRESDLDDVRTAKRYVVDGARSRDDLELMARRLLANDCIERVFIHGFGTSDPLPDRFPEPPRYRFELRRIPLRGLSDEALTRLSREAHLFLSLAEMKTIQAHFAALDRDPTDLELETLAQTWSEHCVHKTLKSAVDYAGDDFGREGEVRATFENLLKDTIVAATQATRGDWCLSVFVDNAGVVAFDDEYGVAFKVETHNHPSAIEPYGGAATGVGGCIRDIMGCGLGARPIASTDVFCLAPPTFPQERLPRGVLHPRRVLKGVVGGVRDYGNRMGIPTVNGAVYFDERFLANPLVFCGCVGLIPRRFIGKGAHKGDAIVLAGGRTGRDGIHGATFSSAELEATHADEFSHAVQIGNAVEEKKLLDAMLRARDADDGCLYSAVTDCGAGGLSSAVGEMAEALGAEVDLERVPLKYAGLRYDEIWISEAQERMVFAVPPENLAEFRRIFGEEDVETAVIGRFSGDAVLRVRFDGIVVGELDMRFLHHGLPRLRRKATWTASAWRDAQPGTARSTLRPAASCDRGGIKKPPAFGGGLHGRLLAALSNPNVASKEWIIRQYDHEVQGRSVIKPLVGPGTGPSDAAVLRPRLDSRRGVALGCGLCPQASDEDPYWMAVRAVDEALRNVVCVGGDPSRTAILDNFCWPKCDTELALGALVRTCRGAADAAIAFGLPFISGKDSLNNEFVMEADEARRVGLPPRLSIPPTLLISALSIIEDVRRCVSMDLKRAGDVVVLATASARTQGLAACAALHRKVAACIADGKVRAAHDVCDGGILVALAEMCIAGRMGLSITWPGAGPSDSRTSALDDLWDEQQTRYLLEISPDDAAASGFPVIGVVCEEPVMTLNMLENQVESWTVEALMTAWRSPLASM